MSNAYHVDHSPRRKPKRGDKTPDQHAATKAALYSPIDCRYCDGATFLAAAIPPLGNDPGAVVFQCTVCDTVNWVKVPPERKVTRSH